MRLLEAVLLVSALLLAGLNGYREGKRSAYIEAKAAAWKSVQDSCYTSPEGYCFSERHKGACYNK